MIPRGAWPPANHSARIASAGRRDKDRRVVHLHRPRRGGEVGRERLVVGERAVAPNDVLGRLARKVGLRIGRGDEGRVWRGGRERVLGNALFGAAEEGAQDRDEELAAFLREDVAKGGVRDVGRDGLTVGPPRFFFLSSARQRGGKY